MRRSGSPNQSGTARRWSGLQRDSQEAAIAFLQSIENEASKYTGQTTSQRGARCHCRLLHQKLGAKASPSNEAEK